MNAKIIYGFYKSINETGQRRNCLESPNQAWNVIEFNGKWFMVDCKNALNTRFQFQPFYFLCPLQAFVNTHFSPWLKWSSYSSSNVRTLEDFLSKPVLNIDFYAFNLRQIQPDLASPSLLKFEYSAPETTLLVAYLIEEDDESNVNSSASRKLIKNSTIIQRHLDTRNLFLRIALPLNCARKQYKVILYAKDPEMKPPIYLIEPRNGLSLDEEFTSVAEYSFKPGQHSLLSNRSPKSSTKFIWFYNPESIHHCHIVKPIEHYLVIDREHVFEIYVRQARAVCLELKKSDLALQFNKVDDDRWLLKCVFEQTDSAILYIKFESQTVHTKVCSYMIIDSDY